MTEKWLEGSGSRHIFAGRGREPWSTPEAPGWGKWGWGAQSGVFVGPGPGHTYPRCSSSVNPTVQRHLNELINLANRENKAGGIQQAAFLISGHSAAPAAGGDGSRPCSAPRVPPVNAFSRGSRGSGRNELSKASDGRGITANPSSWPRHSKGFKDCLKKVLKKRTPLPAVLLSHISVTQWELKESKQKLRGEEKDESKGKEEINTVD